MNLIKKIKILYKLLDQIYKSKNLSLKKISLADISSPTNIKIFETVDFKGGLTLEELSVIISISKKYECKNYLEIGSFRGRTAINIAANNKDTDIHTIDLPQSFEEKNLKFKLLDNDTVQAKHEDRNYFFYKYKEYNKNITNHYGDSATFDYNIFNHKFDLIFIDGSHKYENVVIDSENAINNLSKKGIIIWHDYSIQNLDVVKAINHIIKKYKIKIYSIKNTRFAFYQS